MQPYLYVRSDVLAPSPLYAAFEAYLKADLYGCLALLDGAHALSPADQRNALLLRGRALLRLHRESEVIELLGPALGNFVSVDEACTARMLHAVALLRCVSLDRGIDLLADVAAAARSLYAHPTIQAEISYWTASAYWRKRDYHAALTHARSAEAARADVVSVRAATLRGYVAAAKELYPEALALFRSAREQYNSCRERDQNLLERVVVQIASLEVTLRSASVFGTHDLPPEIGRLPESCVAQQLPGVFRMQIAAMDAWLYAFDAEQEKAYRCARRAENLAPSIAWRLWALANRANITLAFGDNAIAADFADDGFEISHDVDWNATTDEERVGLLFLTEALAVTRPPAAVEVLCRYDELTTEIDRGLLFHDDVRLWIVETFVRALVHRIRGEYDQAWQALKAVASAAKRVKYEWRAALALIELDATPVPGKPRGDFYLEEAAKRIRHHYPRSFLARRLGRWMNFPRDPIVANLGRVPREVLRHVLDAKSEKEIAAAMRLSAGTVHNYIGSLRKAFGVNSTPQLLVACYRRGLGTPAWRTDCTIAARSRVGRGDPIDPSTNIGG